MIFLLLLLYDWSIIDISRNEFNLLVNVILILDKDK
jgi:hypothetical protein